MRISDWSSDVCSSDLEGIIPWAPKQGTSIMQNLVILAGNVGASPESRTTTGGTKITNCRLATSPPKRDSNGKILKDDNNRRIEHTEWHPITCFHALSHTD